MRAAGADRVGGGGGVMDPQVLRNSLREARSNALGAPVARHMADWHRLAPLHEIELNNIGDPWAPMLNHGLDVHALEREVLEMLAPVFTASPDQPWWGFVGSGSTEATLHAMLTGRERYPDAVAYCSTAAHVSVRNVAKALRMPLVRLPVDEFDEVDPFHSAGLIDHARAAVFVATAGTPMREGVDDVAAMREILPARRYIHVDGALSGLALALHPRYRHLVRFGVGAADSVAFSTHKSLGTPCPGAVFLGRADDAAAMSTDLSYMATRVSTLATSRNGHSVAQTALVLERGFDELHETFEWAQAKAAAVAERLPDAQRRPWAFTVSFPAPRPELAKAYGVMVVDGIGKICVMPGVPDDPIQLFMAQMCARDPFDALFPAGAT